MTTHTEQTSVHRVRFYLPDHVKGIHCMAIDTENKKIAVVRRGMEDESAPPTIIEIWDIKHSPCIEQKIYDSDDEPALIESICWGSNGRLFSCGCNGYVNEYDTSNNRIKQRYDISGGPLWCLTVNSNSTKLATGSEDGCISIIDLVEDGFTEVRRLGKMSCRVLSLAWMKEGDKIIAGSQGVISIYSHKEKKLLEKMELDKNCLVWSLATFENVIISGDSNGYTSFWWANTGALGNKYKSHESDVLTVFASNDGLVYSSGIDPKIAQYDAATTKSLPPINVHTHDVRGIVVDKDGSIYSGGQDVCLVKTNIRPKSVVRFAFDLTDCINLWEDILSLRYLKGIELFNIDTKNVTKSPNDLPIKLAAINCKQNIISSAVNSNWIVYNSYDDIVFVNSASELKKVRHNLSLDDVIERMSFLDNVTLALATATAVRVISLERDVITETISRQFEHRIVSLTTSPDSIAIALSNTELIYLPKSSWTPISVSKTPSIPTAMSFSPFELNKLFICTSNKTICKFNLEERNLKMDVGIDVTRLECHHYFRGITFTPKSVLIYTSEGLCSFDPTSLSFKTRISDYKLIVSVNSINDRRHPQIVIVELDEGQFISLLPGALNKKIYGVE